MPRINLAHDIELPVVPSPADNLRETVVSEEFITDSTAPHQPSPKEKSPSSSEHPSSSEGKITRGTDIVDGEEPGPISTPISETTLLPARESVEPTEVPTSAEIPSEAKPDSNRRASIRNRADSSPKKRRSFILILPLLLFLICAAVVIYYLDIVPGLTEFVQRKLKRTETVPQPLLRTNPPAEKLISSQSETGAFRYYLQVSAWDKASLAEKDKLRYIKRNIPAIVEGEYIERKRKTFFRVRLGPFPTKQEAQQARITFASLVPADAFVDSLRTDEDIQRVVPPPSTSRTFKPSAGEKEKPSMSGYVIVVSSFRKEDAANQEAKKLLGRGYSASVRRQGDSEPWFRVMVGPFGSRQEAEKYIDPIRELCGSDIFITRMRQTP